MSNFQTILTAVFGGMILIAVVMFSGLIPGTGFNKSTQTANLVMWGTISEDVAKTALDVLKNDKAIAKLYNITYVYKKPEVYEKDLVNALASGAGPDMFFVTQDTILRQKDKIYVWPYDYYPERTFKDSFVEEGELFLSPSGVVAVPYAVDPMVLYWNRDLFTEKGIAKPPATWNEFQDDSKLMTVFDTNKNIAFSGAALGEFSNVKNAKEILTTLILQSGAKIFGYSGGELQFLWGEENAEGNTPVESAVDFFSRFANTKYDSYSWNRALPLDRDVFTSGSLAMYLGFGSEFNYIKSKNLHLNFDISLMPQISGGKTSATFGKMYGLAVANNSNNKEAAMGAVIQLTGPASSAAFVDGGSYSSARRDVVAEGQKDANRAVINKAAVQAKGWLDLDPEKTYTIFRSMVESIASGRERLTVAVQSMELKMENLNESSEQ